MCTVGRKNCMHPFFRWPCKECFLKSLPHKGAWWYSEGSHSVNHYTIFLSSLLQLGHPWLRRTVSLLPSSNGQVWLSGKFLLSEKWETLMPCEHEERREWIPHHSLGAASSGWEDFISYQHAGGPWFLSPLLETFTGSALNFSDSVWFGGFCLLLSSVERSRWQVLA